MTPEDWKQVEADLSSPYGCVRLRADDHVITLVVERGKGLRYVVAAYINGVIQWVKTHHPEPDAIERKFWRARFCYLYSASKRAEASAKAKKRGMPKEIMAIWKNIAEGGFEILDPTWPNAKALCRHLRKTCAAVERLSDHEAPPAVETSQ
ncbi:hypothetical protein [Thauera sp. 63]|uniref:hypothetical protein n=1 Tax=Thauera sp. 63 TaxID=497321 RepID=UPI0002CDE488|nr:hypothetical protein [Thauera sp. 63]ENO80313.1 hypothetical protein C664_01185 [Thauera sp. 63]